MANSTDLIARVAIAIGSAQVSRAGFKRPLLLSGEAATKFVGSKTKEYRKLDELLTDDFSADGITYRQAASWFSQIPNAGPLLVGKRNASLGINFGGTFTFAEGAEGDTYTIALNGVEYSYTLEAAEDEDDAAAELKTLIDALAAYTATNSTNTITFAVVGDDEYPLIETSRNISFLDTTASSGSTTATDIAAIRAENSQWYGIFSDCNSKGEIVKIATYVQTIVAHFGFQTADNDTYSTPYSSGVTTDVFSTLRASAFTNVLGVYDEKINSGSIAGFYSKNLSFEPGLVNWAHHAVNGISTSTLSDTQVENVKSKRGNTYTEIAGAGSFLTGLTPSGEFVDTINLVHWLRARIAEDLIATLRANRKVPFTAIGITILVKAVEARLVSKLNRGLDGATYPIVTGPDINAIPADVVAARELTDEYPIEFIAIPDGAINGATVSGTLTFDRSLFAA